MDQYWLFGVYLSASAIGLFYNPIPTIPQVSINPQCSDLIQSPRREHHQKSSIRRLIREHSLHQFSLHGMNADALEAKLRPSVPGSGLTITEIKRALALQRSDPSVQAVMPIVK